MNLLLRFARHFSSGLNTRRGGWHRKFCTISQIVSNWEDCFCAEGISEPTSSAELITAHVLGLKTLHGVSGQRELSETAIAQINKLCKKRLSRLPIQYVLKEWDFLEHTLRMKPPVFIPRPETEELVGLVHESIHDQWGDSPGLHLLDIGTGSGAILISLLHLLKRSRGVGVDISDKACGLAEENAMIVGVKDRMAIYQTDVTAHANSWSQLRDLHGGFDLIVSNPPYIPSTEASDLQEEIIRYEDHRALFSGHDGMDFVRLILDNSRRLLNPLGHLWLEVDITHPKMIQLYMEGHNTGLTYRGTHQDFTGRPRFCHLVKQTE